MQNEETEDQFSEFIRKHRKGIYTVMGTIIILFVGLIVYLSLNSYFQKKATDEVEELNNKYAELRFLLADEHYKDDVNALLEKLDPLKGKSGYPGARAWTIIAHIYSSREEWPKAEEAWRNAAKTGKKTYLAPAAFFNAAAAAENQGKIEDAIMLLEKSITYKFDFPAAPHAQFSIGRLYEQLGNIPAAAAAYRAVLVNWPNIETWANLAQSRIIAIED